MYNFIFKYRIIPGTPFIVMAIIIAIWVFCYRTIAILFCSRCDTSTTAFDSN